MLQYLLSPTFQIINSAGKPATGGYLEVYLHGTRTKYYCASDFDGTLLPFKIPLDSLGSNIVLADDSQSYDVYAYNRYGSQLMSRYNVTPKSNGGLSTQEITSTDGSVTVTDTATGVDLSVPPQVNADWDSDQGASKILNKPDLSVYAEKSELATVATTGSYDSLLDKPTIPPAQVNADWAAESGVARILNKPDLGAYATTLAVNIALEEKQDKLVAGNNIQISNNNVISATYTTYSAGTGIVITSDNTISVENPLPASTPAEADKYLKVDSDGNPTWADVNYVEATSTRPGIVKTGDDTVQIVPKNSPSRNKHRTYPVQKNADGQMVVNVPWKDDPVYKGILVLTIEGTCTDTYSAATALTSEHVTSMIVSPYYGEGSSFYGNNNTFSVEYHEVPGHPADSRPVFRVGGNNNLLYTFDNEQQDSLAFHCTLSISSKSGYQYIEDYAPVFAEWGHDSSMKQIVMNMARTLVIQKSDPNHIHPVLGNGVNLVSPRTVDLETTYKIELVAEYLYTSSPSEFLVFDAVDDEGDNMVDNEGDHMIFCEDNPNYTGE